MFPSDDPDERRSRSERSGEHDQHKDERFRTESLYGKSNVRKSFRYTGTDAVLQRASDRTVVFNGSRHWSAFLLTVNERLKEFGVLLSIGARKSQIFQMLLLEAGMIGVLGGFLGVVFSGGGILLFKDVIMESMNMPYLNVNVSQYVSLALQSLGLAVGVSLLATLYAAVRANRMELYKLIQEVES